MSFHVEILSVSGLKGKGAKNVRITFRGKKSFKPAKFAARSLFWNKYLTFYDKTSKLQFFSNNKTFSLFK